MRARISRRSAELPPRNQRAPGPAVMLGGHFLTRVPSDGCHSTWTWQWDLWASFAREKSGL